MLAAVDDPRSLARVANRNLIGLGLAECTLPSWGIPFLAGRGENGGEDQTSTPGAPRLGVLAAPRQLRP